jgi:hypothetical protein
MSSRKRVNAAGALQKPSELADRGELLGALSRYASVKLFRLLEVVNSNERASPLYR